MKEACNPRNFQVTALVSLDGKHVSARYGKA